MQNYRELLCEVTEAGVLKENRTGINTYSLFGAQLRFDLSQGFPLLTTKKMFTKAIIHELLWFIKGSTNTSYLNRKGVRIWDEWADENGDLGPIYGRQWRAWETARGDAIDQLGNVIERIKTNPDCRRLIVSAWNVAELGKMALAPCHCLFQFYVSEGKLSCQLYQRSADIFLGVPFNIASYALLTHMVAQVCNLKVGDFVHTFGDVHLYENHTEQAKEQLGREPLKLPTLSLNPDVRHIDHFKFKDIDIDGYESHPAIKGDVAV